MKKITALALFFVKSFLKQKATTLYLVMTVAFIALAWSVSDINIAKKYKLFEDIVLISQFFLLFVAAIFYGFEFLNKERIAGIFVLPLAMGVSRRAYLLSVVMGLWMMLSILGGMLLLIDALLFYFIEGAVNGLLLWQVFLFLLSSYLVVLLIILFAQFVSVMNSIIYTLTFYFLGNGLDELYFYAYHLKVNETLQTVYSVLIYIIPNFALFDKQGIVVNEAAYSVYSMFVQPVVYTLIASVILFSIAVMKFEKRALKVGQ